MNSIRGILGIALLTVAGSALADETAKPDTKSHVFPEGWYVAPMLEYVHADKKRGTGKNGYGAALALGNGSDIGSIELVGLYNRLPVSGSGSSGSATLTGGELALLVGPFFEQEILSRFFATVSFGL